MAGTFLPRVVMVLALLALSSAWAQDYPTRPIRMLIPQPAGGTMDSNARAISDPMVAEFGQQIVIDNRSGANGIVAGQLLKNAPPDGYTLLYTSGSLLYNEIVSVKVPFAALQDFEPVTTVARSQGYLVLVHPSVAAKSMRELVDLGKSGKARLHYGSGGHGNSQHFVGELLNIMSGASLVHVPYKGFAPLIIALMGNEIQVAFGAPVTVLKHVQDGRLRALAYTGEKRWSAMPNLPTVSEAGVPGFWFEPAGHGIFAPKGTPRPIILKFQQTVAKVVKSPKLLAYFDAGGYVTVGSTPEEFRKFLAEDLQKMREIARKANIKPQ